MKKGTISSNGYRFISKGNSRKNPIRKYEHRIVMEVHLGRQLNRNEHVHHINEDKLDNRIQNLVLLTASEHSKKHALERGFGKDRVGISPTNKIGKDKINYIKKLRQNGTLLKDIQKKVGLSWPTVCKYAKNEDNNDKK